MNKKAMQALIFASGLGMGALGSGLYFKNESKISDVQFPKRDLTTFYNKVFDKDFFQRDRSPFEEMEKMRKEMDSLFESTMKDHSKITFDDWYGSKFGGTIGDIDQDEDDKFVYYKVDIQDVDRDTIKTDVSGGQVTISGSRSEIQAEEAEGTDVKAESYQSFHRSFPVPSGVNADKVEFETKGNELVIKFPKVQEEKKNLI